MRKIKSKVLDNYIKYALLYDALVIAALIALIILGRDRLNIPEKSTIDGLISNLTSTIVSFIGFILASLTIIVTVKANIKIKSLHDAANAMELLLSTDNYKKIISVFKFAIVELLFCLLLLYLGWMPIFNLSIFYLCILAAIGIIVVIFSVSRTLLVLFSIIFLEFHSDRP